jgi:uncharacterized protein YpmS
MIHTITQIHNKEKVMFWSLATLLLLAFAFYFVCINLTVRNVVAREKLEADASRIALEISNKEFQYISMKNALNIESAYAMGFTDVGEKSFIQKNAGGVVSYAPKKI